MGILSTDGVLRIRSGHAAGRIVLVNRPDVPSHGALHVHGALLPVQTRRFQGRAVDRVVVGRHSLHLARGQVREPSRPGQSRDHSGAGPAVRSWGPDPPPGAWHPRWTAGSRPLRPTTAASPAGRGPARGHRLHVAPQRGRAHTATQSGQEAGQAPETGTVHVQVGRQLPEGLRTLPRRAAGARCPDRPCTAGVAPTAPGCPSDCAAWCGRHGDLPGFPGSRPGTRASGRP